MNVLCKGSQKMTQLLSFILHCSSQKITEICTAFYTISSSHLFFLSLSASLSQSSHFYIFYNNNCVLDMIEHVEDIQDYRDQGCLLKNRTCKNMEQTLWKRINPNNPQGGGAFTPF